MLLLSLLGGHHDALHLVEEAAQAPLAVEVVPLQLLLALQQVGERLVLLAGTLLGHALVTWQAVGAGKWIGGRISERLLYRPSGGLFRVLGLFLLKQALG